MIAASSARNGGRRTDLDLEIKPGALKIRFCVILPAHSAGRMTQLRIMD